MEIQSADKNPLVSIIVITYNSAKFVLETLESAKAQTYQNIELIVSDDFSADSTVEICRTWIENNKERFVRTDLITAPHNTGIPANCNRGVKAAKGEWIKYIAGDDILLENCLDDYISFVRNDPDAKIINANQIKFDDHHELVSDIQNFRIHSDDVTSEEQYKYLLRHNRVGAPAIFIKRALITDMGGFDETFRLMEDYPMWLKITRNGIKILYIKNVTVKYRANSGISSKNNSYNGDLITKTKVTTIDIRMKYCLKDLTVPEQFDLLYNYYLCHFFVLLGNNKTIVKNIFYSILKVINPFYIFRHALEFLSIENKYIKYWKIY